MTEAKHTPGPWTIGTSAGYNASHVYSGEDGVCTVYGIFSHQSVQQVVDDPRCAEGMANARLIAAAPDMLEALHKAEGWLAEWASAEPYIGEIRAVIAKATGAA